MACSSPNNLLNLATGLALLSCPHNEAEALQVIKTRTTFVNGRIVIGVPPPIAFAKIVDEALLACPRHAAGEGRSRR